MTTPTTDPDTWTREELHAWLDHQLEPVFGPLTRADLLSLTIAVARCARHPRKGESAEQWERLMDRVFQASQLADQP